MRISDWSSDVCSSDRLGLRRAASLRNREDLHRSRRERPDLEAAPGTSSIASRYDEADQLLRPNLGPRCQPLGAVSKPRREQPLRVYMPRSWGADYLLCGAL